MVPKFKKNFFLDHWSNPVLLFCRRKRSWQKENLMHYMYFLFAIWARLYTFLSNWTPVFLLSILWKRPFLVNDRNNLPLSHLEALQTYKNTLSWRKYLPKSLWTHWKTNLLNKIIYLCTFKRFIVYSEIGNWERFSPCVLLVPPPPQITLRE